MRPSFARPILFSFILFLIGCASGPKKQVPIFSTVPSGELRWAGDLPVLRLRGTPYEMGYQQGALLRKQVRASVKNMLAYADRRLQVPGLGRMIARKKLDRAWLQMKPHVPERYLEEMQGLSDGAAIPLRLIQEVHALADLTSVAGASSVAATTATRDGRLIHIRNLDWGISSDAKRYAALIVQEADGKKPFVNIGWLGFIGVLSGINRDGLSVGQIGAESVDTNLRGVPMPFLLRRVLEEAGNLDEAAKIIETGPRTAGYNYLFADAKAKRAVALETTRQRFVSFPMEGDRLIRSGLALDPLIRGLHLAPEHSQGSGAYEVRTRGPSALLERFHGKIDPEIAMAIARAIAPPTHIQSVVYAYPQIWVERARGRRPAAEGVYQQVDLDELF